MAQCAECGAEIAVYEHRCKRCGAPVRRVKGKVLSSSLSDQELFRAQLSHLLTLPGMLFMGLFFFPAIAIFGIWGLLPVNLFIPFVYWLSSWKSRFVRSHAARALKFQLLWTVGIYLVWLVPLFMEPIPDVGWILAHLVVWLGGMSLVWIASSDAANAGDGKYFVRVPLFGKAAGE